MGLTGLIVATGVLVTCDPILSLLVQYGAYRSV